MDRINFYYGITQVEQKSEEWLEQRKSKLTSSSYGTVLGHNKYSPKESVLFEKCNAGKKFSGNEATYHGERYEREAIDLYSSLFYMDTYDDFGLIGYSQVNEVRKKIPWMEDFKQQNPNIDLSFMGCSVDGIAINRLNPSELILLEVKCPYRRTIIPGEIPGQYLSQVQMNMHIMDIDLADFIEYKPGEHGNQPIMNVVRVVRDPEYFITNVPILHSFWEEILEWREKDITEHSEYLKYKASLD